MRTSTHRRKPVRLAIATVSAAVGTAIFGGAVPANADIVTAQTAGVDESATFVEAATGTADIAATVAAAGTPAKAFTATGGGSVTVTAPDRANGTVSATTGEGSSFGLSLPGAEDVEGIKAGTGTVVYTDAATATDIAVQPTTNGGARTLLTLKDDKAPTTQRFELHLPVETEAVDNGEGGYDLIRLGDDGKPAITVGTIDAPWAKDAHGKDIPTRYRLEGNTLVQTVDTQSNTVYPVVADPKFDWGIVTGTLYFNKSETRKAVESGGFLTAAAAMIPGPGAPSAVTIAGWSTMAAIAQRHGKCLKINTWLKPNEYSGGYCR
ncbi:hypothetical protein [Streptomyces parvus]|uniref:hypothetical protein n=1 Tax=Streptomyces parvus TaxID=66428 RepID=UPI0036888791